MKTEVFLLFSFKDKLLRLLQRSFVVILKKYTFFIYLCGDKEIFL